MWQVILAFISIAIFVYVTKAIIILLFLAGLIFRTKETVGLIIVLVVLGGFATYPLIVTAITATLLAVGFYFKRKERLAKVDDQTLPLPNPDD
ncbi:MAG: hypothetical protein BVN32_12555 [Proteobacteria bacterium ST_bin14]|nr:MAG: hypothetical protein BVN32_12555 [Proteobacteria bacterium ST_bin14]